MARILIVDDQEVNRTLLHAFLEGSGHVLIDAQSGEEAVLLATEEHVDLVLLDVMMPGLDGFQTAARLKAQAGSTFLPIILLTALSDANSRLEGLGIGVDEFLTKPVDRNELMLRIRNLLALRAKDFELRKQNVALAEMHRFKDEMSALIIHDLKNPLSVVLSNHDFLAEALEGAEPTYREALDDAQAAGRRMLRLLENLHDVTRFEASRLDIRRMPTHIGALLTDIVKQRKQLALARHITIEAHVCDAQVLADADLLIRVVENIIDNALRHTPQSGRIVISVEQAADAVLIRIGNTGASIPTEARAAIFEKFGQAAAGTGRMNLGLGLYFCRLAAEAHAGKLWVEDAPDLPTVFVIQLPR